MSETITCPCCKHWVTHPWKHGPHTCHYCSCTWNESLRIAPSATEDEYSQGIMADGPAILKNGRPMTPEEIVRELQGKPSVAEGPAGFEEWWAVHTDNGTVGIGFGGYAYEWAKKAWYAAPRAKAAPAASLENRAAATPRELTEAEKAIVASAKKFERLAGRGMHEIRSDEWPDYIAYLADWYADGPHLDGYYGAARRALSEFAQFIHGEYDRARNDSGALAVKLDNLSKAAPAAPAGWIKEAADKAVACMQLDHEQVAPGIYKNTLSEKVPVAPPQPARSLPMAEYDIVKTLRAQADEIAKDGHAGWGNTMQDAALRIEELEVRLAEAERENATMTKECEAAALCIIESDRATDIYENYWKIRRARMLTIACKETPT